VRAPLADPGLGATDHAHIAVDHIAVRLLQREAGDIGVGRLSIEVGLADGLGHHHIPVKKKSPGLNRVPVGGNPFLGPEEGFRAAGPEVLKRILVDLAWDALFGHPGRRQSDRIVRGARVADNYAVDLS